MWTKLDEWNENELERLLSLIEIINIVNRGELFSICLKPYIKFATVKLNLVAQIK